MQVCHFFFFFFFFGTRVQQLIGSRCLILRVVFEINLNTY